MAPSSTTERLTNGLPAGQDAIPLVAMHIEKPGGTPTLQTESGLPMGSSQ